MEKNVLSGDLEFLGLADVLQLLSGASASGVFEVMDDLGEKALIYFKDGEVINAKYKNLCGKEALFIPFSWERGSFVFEEKNPGIENLIDQNITGLILDGLRLLDEGGIKDPAKRVSFNSRIPLLRGRLIDYTEIVDEEFFEKDELVVREGRYGSWIWVILDGLVQIEKKIKDKNVPVAQLGRGGFIGNLAAFARGDRPRSATVKALSSVQLGVLDAQSLSKEYTAYSDFLKNYFLSIDERLRMLTGAYVRFYSEGYSCLSDLGSVKGLMKEKFKGNKIGIVESGRASLFIESKGLVMELGFIDKGSMVGELPFFDIDRDINFYLKGDDDFAIRPFNKKLLTREFINISANVKKMVEFAGLSLSVTASNLADNFGRNN